MAGTDKLSLVAKKGLWKERRGVRFLGCVAVAGCSRHGQTQPLWKKERRGRGGGSGFKAVWQYLAAARTDKLSLVTKKVRGGSRRRRGGGSGFRAVWQ